MDRRCLACRTVVLDDVPQCWACGKSLKDGGELEADEVDAIAVLEGALLDQRTSAVPTVRGSVPRLRVAEVSVARKDPRREED